MIVLGAVLLILGLILGVQLLWVAGLVLLLVGVLFGGLGAFGRPVGGRRYWW